MVATQRAIDWRRGVEDAARAAIVSSGAALLAIGSHAGDAGLDCYPVAYLQTRDIGAGFEHDTAAFVT